MKKGLKFVPSMMVYYRVVVARAYGVRTGPAAVSGGKIVVAKKDNIN